MDILGQSALLVSLVSFALGFSVLSKNVRNKLFLSFSVVTTVVSAWSMCFFLEKVWPGSGAYRFHLLFNVLLAPVSLWFIRVLMRIRDRFSEFLFQLSAVIWLVLTVALGAGLESYYWILEISYFSPVLIFIQILWLMSLEWRSILGFNQLPKQATVGIGRKQWIFLGALVVLGTSLMDHIPGLGKGLPALGNLSLTVYLFFLSQAITQQRLLNISALFSRFLVLLVVAFTLTIVYSLLVAWIHNSPALFFLNSFIASFLILVLLDPLRGLVGYFTERLLTQKHQKLQQVLREAHRRLTLAVDIHLLWNCLASVIEQVLRPEKAALFILMHDGTKLHRIRTMGKATKGQSSEVLSNHSLIQYCEGLSKRGRLPIVLDQILESEMDRSASRSQRAYFRSLIEALKALDANLLIPLIDSRKVLGFLALDVSAPPEPWGNNWGLLPIIYPFFEHSAQSMRNMEIFARQREKERLAVLGEMAAGLAHEIRNPLGAIRGAAQLLDASESRADTQFVKVIIEEVDRLNRVVSQFLDYSKSRSTAVVRVDLNALIEKSIVKLRPGLPEKIVLEFIAARHPVLVQGDLEQIQQVLINLIQNSVRALEGRIDGLIRVRVDQWSGSALEEAVLIVEDNGRGIKREHLEKLFIPFFTTSPQGTGLGLSICQKVIEALQGRIDVVSEEGRFTRVFVVLPLLKE